MKFSVTILAACFVALTLAQWPCQDYGWNGPIANCASCTIRDNTWAGASTFSVCTNCSAGFFLNQSACIPCTNNCTSCNWNGACTSSGCASGFTFFPSNQTCVACPAALNCAKCTYTQQSGTSSTFKSGPYACTACLNNMYYISSTGACTLCAFTGCGLSANGVLATVANAGAYSSGLCSSTQCTYCASGYYGVTASGVTTCTACNANCLSCTTSGPTCDATGCITGYGLVSSVCTQCNTTVAGCSLCASATTCTTCLSGYFLASASVCTACSTNCTACSSATVCTTCATGSWLRTSDTSCQPCATNCSACAANTAGTAGPCSGCNANNTLSTGVCYGCPANCTTCSLLSSSGTATVCLQCQLGFGLNDTTGQCAPCPPNCDYCDGAGICTQCRQAAFSGNTLPATATSGNSYFAYPVTQGYWLPPNQCQQCPYNCSACSNSTSCLNNCTKNYVYNSTTTLCLPNGAERIVFAGFTLLSVLFYFI